MFNNLLKDVYSKLLVLWFVGFLALGLGSHLAGDIQDIFHINQGLHLTCQWGPDRQQPHSLARPDLNAWFDFHAYGLIGLFFVAWALWETPSARFIRTRVREWLKSLDDEKSGQLPAGNHKTGGGLSP